MDRFEIIPPQQHTRQLPTTLDGVCDRVKSKSYISVLSEETQEEVDRKIRDIMGNSSDDELQRIWIDKEKGTFVYPYVTGECWDLLDGEVIEWMRRHHCWLPYSRFG